jgi:uncharacterized protein
MIQKVRRYDYSALRVTRTPSGGYNIDAYISRCGVQLYTLSDGTTRRELRLPEEVFSAEALASFAGACLTDDHPPEMVTPRNWKTYSIGHVDQPIPEGDYCKAEVHLNDGEAIRKFKAGELVECSGGYYADYHATPGVHPEYGEYDGVQKNIRGNHVALGGTGWGRGGPKVRLITDSKLNLCSGENVDNVGESFLTHPYGDSGNQTTPTGEGIQEMKETIDGVEYTVGTPEHLAALRNSAAKAKQDAADANKAKQTAEDAAKAEKLRADAQAKQLEAAQRERVIALAVRLDPKFDKKDAAPDMGALILQVLKMLAPDYNPEGESPEAIAGALKLALAMNGAAAPAAGVEPADVSADNVQQGELGTEDPEKAPVAQDAATHTGRGSRADSGTARTDANGVATDLDSHARMIREKRARAASFNTGVGLANPHAFGSN